MTIITPSGYAVPSGEPGLLHARILHPGVWVEGGTASASSTDADFYVDGPNNDLTVDRWKNAVSGGIWQLDGFSAQQVDCVGIAAHTLGSEVITFRIQAEISSVWTDVTSNTTVGNDESIMALFSPVTATGIRVVIASGRAELGVVRVGKSMPMPQKMYSGITPSLGARDVEYQTNMTRKGEIAGLSKRRVVRSFQPSWTHLAAEWVRTNWYPFQKASEGRAVFIAWRPGSFGDVDYGAVQGISAASNMGVRSYMTAGFEMTVYAHE